MTPKENTKINHCGSRFLKYVQFGHFTSLGSLSKPTPRRERECGSVLVYRFTRKLPLFFLFFRSHWLAVVYCLVYCIGSCEQYMRTEPRTSSNKRFNDQKSRGVLNPFTFPCCLLQNNRMKSPSSTLSTERGRRHLIFRIFIWN